jgi:hypothetical protein
MEFCRKQWLQLKSLGMGQGLNWGGPTHLVGKSFFACILKSTWGKQVFCMGVLFFRPPYNYLFL